MRTAVIGIGGIARRHLAALDAVPEARLSAVCDRSPAAAEAAAERYGAERWFTDHREMLAVVAPDVVHVTTPPQSHAAIATDALDARCHVIVEKPAATTYDDVVGLADAADAAERFLVEDYNYLFNPSVLRLLELVRSGQAGTVLHVDVSLALDVLEPGGMLAEPTHPIHALRGGAMTDFLPHLCSLVHAFVGSHRRVATLRAKRSEFGHLPADELRALVDGADASATMSFSANSGPDALVVRVDATELRALASVFDERVVVRRRRPGKAVVNSFVDSLLEAKTTGTAALADLVAKVGGRSDTLAGVGELIRRTYAAAASGAPAPVSVGQVRDVNRLLNDVIDEANDL